MSGRFAAYKITRIVNYLRRSRQDVEREKRTGEDTLAEQKMLMDRVLGEFGIPYVQKLEVGSGDRIATRPVFREVLAELQEGVYDAVAVKELSRLGRGSYADMGQIYDLLREKRIYIITPWRVYDPTNTSDARQIRFELFLSREEFETTRERLLGARYNYALQGKWMAGAVPYGYRFDSRSQRLLPHRAEAEVVRAIFTLYAQGEGGKSMGIRAIATHLTKLGIQTAKGRKCWQPEVIARILRKPVYLGQVRFRITERTGGSVRIRPEDEWIVVDGAHEPIVERTLFDEVQRQLANSDQKPRVKWGETPSELTGLVVCAICGKRMVRQHNVQRYRKQDGAVSTYHKEFLYCLTPGCASVKYRDVEESILLILQQFRFFSAAELRFQYEQEVLHTLCVDAQESLAATLGARALARKSQELDARLERVYDKLESGVYSDEEFNIRRAAVMHELAELQEVLQRRREPTAHRSSPWVWPGPIETFAALYRTLTDRRHKNALLLHVFEEVALTVQPRRAGGGKKTFRLDVRTRLNLL